MIKYETIISNFDDKTTLYNWLRKVEEALKNASATNFVVNKKGNATLSFSITFADGTTLESGDIVLQQGESVDGARIASGVLQLHLTNGTWLTAGDLGAVSSFSIDANQHLIVNYQDGTSQDLGAIFNGDITISGDLAVTGDVTFGGAIIGGVNTDANKKYKIISCVLRNFSGTWGFINDSDHRPLNCDSVSQTASSIVLNYGFTAKKVISLLVTTDEDFAEKGYFVGASVGMSQALIEVCRKGKSLMGGYVSFNGANWTFEGSDITAVSFDNGDITITHKSLNSNSYGRSVTCRDGKYIATIKSIGDNVDIINLYDYEGNLVTSPTANTALFWLGQNLNDDSTLLDPANVDQNGNLWVLGIMEVN